jgi:hypothetical protein
MPKLSNIKIGKMQGFLRKKPIEEYTKKEKIRCGDMQFGIRDSKTGVLGWLNANDFVTVIFEVLAETINETNAIAKKELKGGKKKCH